eukprot:3292309-Rhodomonas_salina.2
MPFYATQLDSGSAYATSVPDTAYGIHTEVQIWQCRTLSMGHGIATGHTLYQYQTAQNKRVER